jgi:hypothetical protein
MRKNVNEELGYILPLDAIDLLGISKLDAFRNRRVMLLLDESVMYQ